MNRDTSGSSPKRNGSAKKTGPKKSTTRLRPLSVAQLASLIKAIGERVASLKASHQEMVDKKISEIPIDGVANLQDSIVSLDKVVLNVGKGLLKAKPASTWEMS